MYSFGLNSWVHYNLVKSCSALNTYAGHDKKFGDGGNVLLAMSSLARWDSPLYEADDQYPANGVTKYEYTKKDAAFHIQDATFLVGDSSDIEGSCDELKQMIYQYGGAYLAFLVNYDYFSKDCTNYYLPSLSTSIIGGHAVLAVGWDDNYPASNFSVKAPGDGAFICRNSWGEDFGDNGYFYISYYDASIFYNNFSAIINGVENADNYDAFYEYDPLGVCTSKSVAEQTVYTACVFPEQGAYTQTELELEAVSFYTLQTNVDYEIFIVSDYISDESLRTDTSPAASGSIRYCGYHTIKLNSPIAIEKDSRFAVIIKLTCKDGIIIPIEYPIQAYSSNAGADDGECYIKEGSNGWYDLNQKYSEASLCIKAFVNSDEITGCINLNDSHDNTKVYSVSELAENNFSNNPEFIKYLLTPVEYVNNTDIDNNSVETRLFGRKMRGIKLLELSSEQSGNISINFDVGCIPDNYTAKAFILNRDDLFPLAEYNIRY